MGLSLMTDDGEAIEGAALEGEVLGRVTFFINRALVMMTAQQFNLHCCNSLSLNEQEIVC